MPLGLQRAGDRRVLLEEQHAADGDVVARPQRQRHLRGAAQEVQLQAQAAASVLRGGSRMHLESHLMRSTGTLLFTRNHAAALPAVHPVQHKSLHAAAAHSIQTTKP